jgi:hypothetical protein
MIEVPLLSGNTRILGGIEKKIANARQSVAEKTIMTEMLVLTLMRQDATRCTDKSSNAMDRR